MDGLKKLKGVVVVGTTNRINSIDAALRREGRFGEEIHIGIPDSAGRKEILAIHTRKMPLAEDVNLQIIANKTHGFVGADLASLCREAAYCTVRRNFPPAVLNSKDEITINESINISQSDFEVAVKSIKPSGMREFLIEIPNVSWDEIGGLDDIKQLLMKNITYGITKRDVLSKFGVKPARGVLLYGPPGTGKTLLAKALASECGANFISIKGPELKSKWFGESEEKIRFIFSRAREMSPCVIFFDEIDAAVSTRGRSSDGMTDSITNQILSEMDGIESADGVFVIGATNRAELLDPALLRPGRFDYHIEVPLPPPPVRMAIFKVQLKNKPLSTDVNLERLVEMTLGFSGADIAEVCREATWAAIEGACFEADRVKVTAVHLSNAISQVKQNAEKLKRPPLGFMPPREE